MTYEAQHQIAKAIRSLPWYMFLVPALLTLFVVLFDMEAIVSNKDPELSYWGLMWIIAKLGFFLWVLRQVLRYAMFGWMTKLQKAVDSYSQEKSTASSRSGRVGPPSVTSPSVTIISRREIPRTERQAH